MDPPPGPGEPVPAEDRAGSRVDVVLAPPLNGWTTALRGALDHHFAVSVGPPPRHGVAVVTTVEPDAVRSLRHAALHTGLIVVIEGQRPDSVPTAELFDAGADVVLTAPDVRMLAAHVRALARRYG